MLGDARFYVRFLRDPVDCLIRLDREPGATRDFVRKGRQVAFLLGPPFSTSPTLLITNLLRKSFSQRPTVMFLLMGHVCVREYLR